jgi:Uma2 family endonuclease
MVFTISPTGIDVPPGSEATLRYQTWADYEAMLTSRGDNAAVKLRYNAHTQELRIMAPLPAHGNRSRTLSDLVMVLLRHQNRDWHGFDPITLKRLKEAGTEPDACFYIQNWQVALGKERIDLSQDPPPDLVLEMDWTSYTDLSVYEILGVPEVWIYRQASLSVYVLTAAGYEDRTTSPTFPAVDVKNLLPQYVERAWTAGSSVALREFEAFLQQRP